ncbi:thiopeptide-type bacteriocin biosynthesis domain protein [Ostertagia ostertagi]
MQTIQLDTLPLPEVTSDKTLPNSLNLMFSLADDHVCLEHAGGSTANILNGRFSIADEAIHKLCKDIAQLEAEANPEVTFFDIGYLVGSRTDNINRRKSFYEKQMPLLNYSTVKDPLSLRDMMVSVQGSQLILTSKATGKRLIPRMASAYNYGHSDLPVYRLLCDLQHQGIHSYLHFDAGSLLPELDHYPRIQYKNIILSPAKWIINRSELPASTDPAQLVADTRALLQTRGLSPYFKTGMADQTLVFDMHSDQDIKAFLMLTQKQQKAELSEVILPRSPDMQDTTGKPYAGQYVVSMVHGQNIYRGITADLSSADLGIQRVFPPGSEWLYFEIYCHAHRANNLLCGKIQSFLHLHAAQLQHWFFIRYNQHGNHLRLRLKLHDPIQGQQLISGLSKLLSHELTSGIVSDIQVKTYHRELERYSPELIDHVEIHFHRDSAYVVSLLKLDLDNEDLYQLCSQAILRIRQRGLLSTQTLGEILAGSAAAFGREHHMNTNDYKKLNAQYQKYRSKPAVQLENIQLDAFEAFCASFIDVLDKCPESRRPQLLTDLLHMHVNRLFSTLQRTHEMILYDYLLKAYKAGKAKAKFLIHIQST